MIYDIETNLAEYFIIVVSSSPPNPILFSLHSYKMAFILISNSKSYEA